MRKGLRVAAAVGAVLVLTVWIALGANRGWTKTTHTRMEKDPITEIEFPVTVKRFSPGVDFLAAGLLLPVLIGGISFFVGRKPDDSQRTN